MDISPKLIQEDSQTRIKDQDKSSKNQIVKKEPKFVKYLTKLNLTEKTFDSIRKLDVLAAKCQVEDIDSQIMGHFQFYRKVMFKIFTDSDAFVRIDEYLGNLVENSKIQKSLSSIKKKFQFDKALQDFERVAESVSFEETQKFLDSLIDFSAVFNIDD